MQGLRTLERLRATNPELFEFSGSNVGHTSSGGGGGYRKKYQRFKGPFLDQLTELDLKKEPKPWMMMLMNGQNGSLGDAYNCPASLEGMLERVEVGDRRIGSAHPIHINC